MADANFSRALQENLLVLLAYSSKHFKFIRNAIDSALFEPPYDDFVRRLYNYIDNYEEPAGDHLADVVEDVLNGDDKYKATTYLRVIQSVIENKDRVSARFTLDRLDSFVRRQSIVQGILESAEILDTGGEDAYEQVEALLTAKMKQRLEVFDSGLFLERTADATRFFDEDRLNAFPTGIPALDQHSLGPIRGGLHLLIGGPKSGKSQWLVNLAKRSLMQGFRVAYISLEMDENLVMQRIVQSYVGMTKRDVMLTVPRFVRDQLGRLDSIDFRKVKPLVSMDKSTAKGLVEKRLNRLKRRQKQLVIKRFPTSQLTVRQLQAYLERLAEAESFVPDLLIIDYPDLMSVDTANYRISLGGLFRELRGIAVERDFAVATVTQAGREGVKRRRVQETDVAEDFSKIATADVVLTYNQTEAEKALNLGRITVAAARGDVDKFEIALAQNYAMGQFVRDSIRMWGNYHDIVNTKAEEIDAI